ncbi:hypothetical protein SYNPS1DRAFT_31055 [Syncephalis pseudoplumigaleata]|uniref:Uncharacterized protein n=1 Tax=Syncephalis pseudoplumigaleata TaxID=1712513 RepID=A0A4P9YUZ8_9FUNG|nr:hypothetical protein SYNPS1DRAFT_31055 [Syncephalis pseudoplumigaleata]|eukprot:RKP23232.1 hypothetical protein SYNPS1DRAFT_31055 [Syncephalis pseudoplumigaleata]
MKAKGVNLASHFKAAAQPDTTMPATEYEHDGDGDADMAMASTEEDGALASPLEEMPAMDMALEGAETTAATAAAAEEEEEAVSGDHTFITALPRRSLRHPSLMKLRSAHRASAVSSPSDKLMSPASQQLQLHRHRRLPR